MLFPADCFKSQDARLWLLHSKLLSVSTLTSTVDHCFIFSIIICQLFEHAQFSVSLNMGKTGTVLIEHQTSETNVFLFHQVHKHTPVHRNHSEDTTGSPVFIFLMNWNFLQNLLLFLFVSQWQTQRDLAWKCVTAFVQVGSKNVWWFSCLILVLVLRVKGQWDVFCSMLKAKPPPDHCF